MRSSSSSIELAISVVLSAYLPKVVKMENKMEELDNKLDFNN